MLHVWLLRLKPWQFKISSFCYFLPLKKIRYIAHLYPLLTWTDIPLIRIISRVETFVKFQYLTLSMFLPLKYSPYFDGGSTSVLGHLYDMVSSPIHFYVRPNTLRRCVWFVMTYSTWKTKINLTKSLLFLNFGTQLSEG